MKASNGAHSLALSRRGGAVHSIMSGSDRGYSISLSARSNNAEGTVTPIALAVLRLIASSHFVGCSTGRSAGIVPRNRLAANRAVADKATLLGLHSPLIHGWKAQCCNSFHN